MMESCAAFTGNSGKAVPNNSEGEMKDVHDAIKQVAEETDVDERFILEVMLQESSGCVRAPTTNGGVRNPGLMQNHDGSASCNDETVEENCPKSTITAMIRQGGNSCPCPIRCLLPTI